MDATNTALENTGQGPSIFSFNLLEHCEMFGLKKCKKNRER